MSTAPTHRPPPASPPAEPRIGRIVLGLVLVLIGAAWLLDTTGLVDMRWGMLLPAALLVVGIALLATAHRGASSGLITAGIILSVLVLLTSLFTVRVPERLIGIGDVGHQPTTVAEVEEGFGLGVGSLEVDLRAVPVPDEPVTVEAGVGIGELVVRVPPDTTVDVQARAGIGEAVVLDRSQGGVGVELREWIDGPDPEATLELEVSVGIGKVEVRE